LYSLMNSSNFIIFLLYSFMTKILSSRIFIHVLIRAFSSLFNQYLNWSIFRTWYEVMTFSNLFSIIFVRTIDARRVFLINRLDDFDSIDLINSTSCLFLETILSWIMILLQMIYADTTRIDACLMLDFLLDWFKIK
jgi:hypothetical protein